jgi:hypothetical protein
LHVIGLVGAGDGDRVEHAVGRTTAHGAQVDVGLVEVGAGQVAEGHGVGAAERGEVERVDIAHVHPDVRDVTGEDRVRPVGADRDLLVGVRAVEDEGVVAGAAVDVVVALAGHPPCDVVARAEDLGVVAALPVDGVVAAAAEDQVVAVATEDQVVSSATDEDVVRGAAGDRVVARAAVDGDRDRY